MKKIVLMAVCLMSVSAWGQSEPKSGGVLSSANGRYVFGQVRHARRDQYMLDTQTGRLWQIVQSTYKKEDGSQGTYEMLQSITMRKGKGKTTLHTGTRRACHVSRPVRSIEADGTLMDREP